MKKLSNLIICMFVSTLSSGCYAMKEAPEPLAQEAPPAATAPQITIQGNDGLQITIDKGLAHYSLLLAMLQRNEPAKGSAENPFTIQQLSGEQLNTFRIYAPLLRELENTNATPEERIIHAKEIGSRLAERIQSAGHLQVTLENWAPLFEIFNYLDIPEGVEALNNILAHELAKPEVLQLLYDNDTDLMEFLEKLPHEAQYSIANQLIEHNKKIFTPWDVEAENLLWHNPRGIATNAHGSHIIRGFSDGTIQIWDRKNLDKFPHIIDTQKRITAIATSADGTIIVSGLWNETNGIITLWNAETEEKIDALRSENEYITSIAVNTDGSIIVFGSRDGITLWNRKNRTIKILEEHRERGGPAALAISADEKTIFSGEFSGTITQLDIETENKIATFSPSFKHGGYGHIQSMAIHPDGNTIVFGFSCETILIYNRSTHEEIILSKRVDRPFGEEVAACNIVISYGGDTIISNNLYQITVWQRTLVPTLKENGLTLMQILTIIMLENLRPREFPNHLIHIFQDPRDNNSQALREYLERKYNIHIV